MKKWILINLGLLVVSLLIPLLSYGQESAKQDGVDAEVAIVAPVSEVDGIDLKRFKDRGTIHYHRPEQRNDQLLVASVCENFIDLEAIVEMVNEIETDNQYWYRGQLDKPGQKTKQKGCIDSFLLSCNDSLIVEEYFADSAIDEPHFQMSITKSILSLAIGIAIDQGHIKSEKERLIDYLPGIDTEKIHDLASTITIEDALTMRSGIRLEKPEWDSKEVTIQNHAALILEHCEMVQPGSVYKYQGIDPELLSHVLYTAIGYTLEQFVDKYLFEPMGISNYTFGKSECGLTKSAAGMHLTSRDMIKIGQLILNKGNWKGQQLVSASWIKKAIQSHVDNGKHQYGYFWWQHKITVGADVYLVHSCRGARGQFIYIIPEFQSVAVFTSYGTRKPFELLEKVIVPALIYER